MCIYDCENHAFFSDFELVFIDLIICLFLFYYLFKVKNNVENFVNYFIYFSDILLFLIQKFF